MVLHLVGLRNKLLVADLALEWLDTSMLSKMNLQIVPSKVRFGASFIMTFIPMLSCVNGEMALHQFTVLEPLLAVREDTFDLLWISLDVAEHVVLPVLLLLERLVATWLRTLKHSNLKVELQMLLERFLALEILSTVVDNAWHVLLNLVDLDQFVLFGNNSKYGSRKLRLDYLFVLFIFVLGDSLVRQLDLYDEYLFVFVEQRHTVFVHNGVLFPLIVGEIHFEDLLLHEVVNHPQWHVCGLL